MRQYIGNITTHQSNKVESDPKREAMRLALIDQCGAEIVKQNSEKILGQSNSAYLFDSSSKPPANITVETIARQRNAVIATLQWIKALLVEMHSKLQSLSPEQYALDQDEKETLRQKNATKAADIFKKNYEEKYPDLPQQVQEELRTLIESKLTSHELKQKLRKDAPESYIIGSRQIEKIMRYLFAEYIKNKMYVVTEWEELQYNKMKAEVDNMEAMLSDLRATIEDLGDMQSACASYMNNKL